MLELIVMSIMVTVTGVQARELTGEVRIEIILDYATHQTHLKLEKILSRPLKF